MKLLHQFSIAGILALASSSVMAQTNGSYYHFMNKESRLVMDVRDGSALPAAQVQQWRLNDTDAQRWKLEHQGSDWWKIRATHSGKYLNISGASTIPGGLTIQWPRQTTYTNDQWQFIHSGESGYFHIMNRNSRLLLGVAGGSHDRGTNVVQWTPDGTANQKWRLAGTRPGKLLGTKYNQVQQISSHNSYDIDDGKPDIPNQLNLRVRSLEYDIHNCGRGGEWKVFHTCTDVGFGCLDCPGGEHVQYLSQGLTKLRHWSDSHPGHEVITLWLQVCDDWDASHTIEMLDILLVNYLGEDRIYKPYDLLNASGTSNLREAVNSPFSWPNLEDLRRKFIIVLMGEDRRVANYLENTPAPPGYRVWKSNRPTPWKYCFVAAANEAYAKASCPPNESWVNCIFFNLNIDETTGLAYQLYSLKRVTRVWGEHGAIDNPTDWRKAFDNYVHHLATNFVTRELFNSNRYSPSLFDRYKQPFRFVGDDHTWPYWP